MSWADVMDQDHGDQANYYLFFTDLYLVSSVRLPCLVCTYMHTFIMINSLIYYLLTLPSDNLRFRCYNALLQIASLHLTDRLAFWHRKLHAFELYLHIFTLICHLFCLYSVSIYTWRESVSHLYIWRVNLQKQIGITIYFNFFIVHSNNISQTAVGLFWLSNNNSNKYS